MATRVREAVLLMATSPAGTHLGGALSATELLVALFAEILDFDSNEPGGADHFILSKGHAGSALYAVLAERGLLSRTEITEFSRGVGRLAEHPTPNVPCVEFATGSLGHGLAVGVGLTLAARRSGHRGRCFVLLGDGELQEGSVWEAARLAAVLGLDNLVAIVDANGLQINGPTSDDPSRIHEKLVSFGWSAILIDGHDFSDVVASLRAVPFAADTPSAIIAQTTKGKGIAFLERKASSHHVALTLRHYERAMNQLGGRRA